MKGGIDCDLPLERFSGFLFDGIKRGNRDITEFTLERLSHWYGSDVIRNLLNVVEFVDDEKFRRVADALVEIGPPAVPLIVDKLLTADRETKLRLLELLKQCPTLGDHRAISCTSLTIRIRMSARRSLICSGFPAIRPPSRR